MAAALCLSIQITESGDEGFPAALSLARTATTLEIKSDGKGRSYLAVFADLTESLDQVIRLFGELVKISGVQATIDDRRIDSLTQFWSALLCYRESLDEPNPHDHCLRKSVRVSDVSGCPDRTCVTHCQFICTRCLDLAHNTGSPPMAVQLLAIARQAEADWCPNLRLPNDRLGGEA